MRTLPDELRNNWEEAHKFLFVQGAPDAYVKQFKRFKEDAGMTDSLIVAAIERAIEQKKKHPLAWVQTVLSSLAPHEIRTPEAWAEFERQRETDERAKAPKKAPKFGADGRRLATMMYDHLKDLDALPTASNFFVRQAIYGERMVQARPVEEWQVAFDWAKADPYHLERMTSLQYLAETVWPKFALSRTKTRRNQPQSTYRPFSELEH